MKSGKVVFGAVGDIDLSRGMVGQVKAHGSRWPFEKMLPFLRQADFLWGNMESVVLPGDFPDDEVDPGGLVSTYDATACLQEAGFDFLNLANNHVLDGGVKGMFHTREVIEGLGIAAGGVGQDQGEARRMVVVEKGGVSFGFLCYAEDWFYTFSTKGPCYAYYDVATVLEDISRHRERVDILVVSVHADLEFMETPSLGRLEAFRRFAEAGATVVLGHHPHVPQGVEMIGGSLVVYSLGNFFFPAHSSPYQKDYGPNTSRSFLLLAEVSAAGVESFSRIPFSIGEPPEERPVPLRGSAGEGVLRYFDELDKMLVDDALVRERWRAACLWAFDQYFEHRLKKVRHRETFECYLWDLWFGNPRRTWLPTVLEVLAARWEEQRERVDPYHYPLYRLTHREASSRRGCASGVVTRWLRRGLHCAPGPVRRFVRGLVDALRA